VTFRLDNSLIGDCGFIRKATVGLSGKVSETNFMKSDNTFIKSQYHAEKRNYFS
jgi:hypothetical protein